MGVLEPGHLADIIAVSSDPLQISEQCKTSDL